MLQALLFGILLISIGCSPDYEVVLALNCGGTTQIKTEVVNYRKDNYYSTNSRSYQKKSLSRSIKDPQEKNLLKTQRIHSESFSYSLPIEEDGNYGIAMKFIEQVYEDSQIRVFNVKLGDDKQFSLDIFMEVGAKKPLTKFIEFQLSNEVAYINESRPLLNAYNYINKTLLVNFEKVRGDPKIQAIVLVKGDFKTFRKDYEEKQQGKQEIEYICQKIYNIPKTPQIINPNIEELDLTNSILQKFLSLKGLLSLLVFIVMAYQQTIQDAYIRWRGGSDDKLKQS